MVTWIVLICVVFVSVVEVTGTHLDPECPRRRGLPDGFHRTENRFRNRALFRLDLRSAIKGFVPGKEYRFRVQTTYRKLKFNDATVFIDAINENCGAGTWVTDTDDLYSPKGCPSIVTTQQKEPMGRALFKWIAPACGCVHIRARVHANSTYYIENETNPNGPLARTVCSNVRTETKPVTTAKTTTVMPEVLTRSQRLKLLCDVTKANKAEDVMKNENFLSRRTTSKIDSFELERLNIAVEQRHLEVLTCCDLGSDFERAECFGDLRRVRIDTFCGNGEPDIPLTETRYDWIKQKQPECCPQIGEDRYTCFNYTLHEEEMLKDSHGQHSTIDMDDFDPVNYVEDYPQADEIRQKLSQDMKKTTEVSHIEESTKPRANVQYKSAIDEEHIDDIDDKPDMDREEEKETSENDESDEDVNDQTENNKKDDAKSRALSVKECCMNGIDAGTRVAAEGFDGCFKIADKFHSYFTNWSRQCDRHFVICCMRVIDGDFQEVPKFFNLRKFLLPHKLTCHKAKLSRKINVSPDHSIINHSSNAFKTKKDRPTLKLLKINNENEVVKIKDNSSHFKSRNDYSGLLHFPNIKHNKKHEMSKIVNTKRKKSRSRDQNMVLKHKRLIYDSNSKATGSRHNV